jgi:hypothetical protein
MAETIPGGAYLHSDGKTWQDSEGRPLKGEQVSEAVELLEEKASVLAEQERSAQRREAVARSALRDLLLDAPAAPTSAESAPTAAKKAGGKEK